MKRAARIARFAITSAILFTLTILILRGRDPTFASFYKPSQGELALDRVVTDVHINPLSFDQAARLLGRKAGVRITLDEFSPHSGPFSLFTGPPRPANAPRYQDSKVVLNTRQITLRDALTALIGQVQEFPLDVCPEKDGVHITDAFGPADHWFLQAYDLRSSIARGPHPQTDSVISTGSFFGGPGPARCEVVSAATAQMEAAGLRVPLDAGASVTYSSGWLFVLGPDSVQRSARKFVLAFGDADALFGRNSSGKLKTAALGDGDWVPVESSAATALLSQPVPTIDLLDEPLEGVFPILSKATGTKIVVDWAALDTTGLEQKELVSLHIEGMTLSQALRAVMGDNYEPNQISVRESGGIVSVSPPPWCTRAYDLRPYFAKFNPPEYDAAGTWVKESIAVRLGNDATQLEFVGPYLIVTNTWDNQDTIAALLTQLIESPPKLPVQWRRSTERPP